MTLSRTHMTILSVICILGILMPAAHAAPEMGEPAPVERSLIAIPVSNSDSEANLLSHLIALSRMEHANGDYWLVLATAGDQATLTSRGVAFRTLADVKAGQRLYWMYTDAGRDLPAATQPLLADGTRYLAQMTPAQAEELYAQGYPLIEARRQLPPRTPAGARAGVAANDPAIQGILQQVTAPMLAGFVADLSGENEVVVNGKPLTIQTRYSGTEGMFDAADYLYQYYEDLGLSVEQLPFRIDDWVNVVATQTGRVRPDQVYVICAHYDSISETPFSYAPGADDNASGSATVMAAAQILSQYAFDHTIRYVHFSGEEQGLYGSKAYAHQAANLGEEIMGVINLDMIAWDDLNGPIFELHAGQPASASRQLADVFLDIVDVYDLDLDIEMRLGAQATNRSDHASFWQEGYAAFLAIEDFDDFTPYYHSTADTLETLDMDYFVAATQAALGALSTLAGLLTNPGPLPTPTITATPTATPAGPNRINDGNFEAGDGGGAWEQHSAGGYALISQENPRQGEWGGWFNQQNNAADTLCQTLTLPANAEQITLDFWWQMQTDEVVYGYDWLETRARPEGASRPTVLARFDSGDLQHLWSPARLSLQDYAGANLELCFVSYADYWWVTHFFVDDVQVSYSLGAQPTATTTATATPTASVTPTATRPAPLLWLPLIRK
jgi:hypothetical protein